MTNIYRVTVTDTRTYSIAAESQEEASQRALVSFNLSKHKIDCSLPLVPCEADGYCPHDNDPTFDCGKCHTKYVKGGLEK